MRLEVRPGGEVVLTAPIRASDALIERFFAAHALWVERHVARMRKREVVRLKRSDLPSLKRRAREIAEERSLYFSRAYGVEYSTISIRAQKTRWGSCSRRGALSFNYKIAALPSELADYIVVHEVCHLLAFDHSQKFWDLVARTVPEHRALRKRLRNMTFVQA